VTFTIEADRFLHHMVRFLVGAMVDIALGRRPPADFPRLLAATDNLAASPPAPPQGLYLVAVRYPRNSTPRPVHEILPRTASLKDISWPRRPA